MNTLKNTGYAVLLSCLTVIISCKNSDKSKDTVEDATEAQIENHSDLQGADHTYDFAINPESGNERHLKGEIANQSVDDGTINNFSVYSNTENGKGVVLRIANDDIMIAGLFFYDENGNTSDLSDGSEDESDEKSSLIITLKPLANDVQSSISGTVKLSNLKYALENAAGGAIAYTLVFDGEFEDIDDNRSRIKGTVVVKIPNYL